ncbi:MAG: YwaF family protein [Candidatus Izimaplasma sp.]|nr:YwaF family protein [Candidatus Izimaplasma bacterium]
MFTSMHLVQFMMFIVIIMGFYAVKDEVYNSKYEKQIRYILASILLISEITLIFIEVGAGEIYLPFHLCLISYYLTIVLLITNNEKIFSFVFFIGILGGIVSFAIPEFGNRYTEKHIN